MKRLIYRLGLTACLLLAMPVAAVTYLSSGDFLGTTFKVTPSASLLWLTPEHQAVARQMLGHPYAALRLRYFRDADRTAWILDEIGKERPITIGVVIDDGALARIEILEYREPRGGEVRHPFFTRQFTGRKLDSDGKLDGPIDGISGATLSVRAVTNVGRFALYLHQGLVRAEP